MAGSGWFSSRQAKALGLTSRMDVYMVISDIKNSSQLKLLTHPEPFQDYGFPAFLVESTKGDLLHILRNYALTDGFLKHNNRHTTGFEVYKWVFDDEDGSIRHKVELKSIGNAALFVGDNDSIFVILHSTMTKDMIWVSSTWRTELSHNLTLYAPILKELFGLCHPFMDYVSF
ncbi:unnamed protein product [Prunus armeniaca]